MKRWILVRIDFDASTIYVENQKANIHKLGHFDGIDGELLWGADAAADQLVMDQPGEGVWTYEP